jgi:DNA modification methylase
MRFNKDAIREKHIWKDVEWGKRAKNYNPKGKDPGNVWIPTNDDGKANITEHILLSDDDVIARILSLSDCGDDFEIFRQPLPVSSIKENNAVFYEDNVKSPVSATVIFGSSENMSHVEDKSVSVAVTSPPYWNLKDYFKEGQIGQEPYEKYLVRMKTVWQQCYNKLKPSGSLWVNINIRIHDKKVILIPEDFIEMCKDIGFYYKGIFIWHKSSGIPTGERNIVDRHEYVLIFSKSEEFYIDRQILSSFSDYKNNSINGGAFWNINRKAGSVGKKYIHPAIYPNELVKRIVLMTTKENELVLDQFLGSGTSLISSLQCSRSFIGYEYNEGFKGLMESRFKSEIKNYQVNFVQ